MYRRLAASGLILLISLCLVSCDPTDRQSATSASSPAAPTGGATQTPATEVVATPYKAAPGPNAVAVLVEEWLDAKRDRQVPVKIYYPKAAGRPAPIIVFSHGLGGTRDGYEYLGRYWASHGYVSVHLQHHGSDDGVWKDARPAERLRVMRASIRDPMAAIDRPKDVSFAIDRLEAMNRAEAADAPLKGRLDLQKIAMAGHSYGAWTTLAVAGQVFVVRGDRQVAFGDPRIKAAIAMSASVPRDGANLDVAFGKITIPCLHMTGTLDDSPVGDTKAAERRLPFDHSKACERFLLTLTGGDHMVFSGRPRRMGGGEKDAEFQDLIRQSSLAFLDTYLRDDAAARTWLAGGGFQKLLGSRGVFEQKLRPVPAKPAS